MTTIINGHTDTAPRINWERPAIQFDPWPFGSEIVPVAGIAYQLQHGGPLTIGTGRALTRGVWDTLAYATDGYPIIVHTNAVDALDGLIYDELDDAPDGGETPKLTVRHPGDDDD